MEKILRTDSDNPHFRQLVELLDRDLNGINGDEQEEYNKHNVIDYLDTVVLSYVDSSPVGCGAFKEIGEESVEIKRVFVKKDFRGRGLSRIMLQELEVWAKNKGYKKALLETGKKQEAAIGLYKSMGYKVIDNYGPYIGLSNSVCMSKEI